MATNGEKKKNDTKPARVYPFKGHSKNVWLGGPGTMLPFWLESLMAWTLAIGCLGVALYHWMKQLILPSQLILPLTTHSRREIQAVAAIERYRQLTQLLEKSMPLSNWSDSQLVLRIRKDPIARRLASLLMLQRSELLDYSFELVQRLEKLWPQLVQLPDSHDESQNQNKYKFEISVVMPTFKEDGRQLLAKLQKAHAMAFESKAIEIILVNAGQCTQLDIVLQKSNLLTFGKLSCVEGMGGRGPCLNQGAAMAQGRILTFLHADTRLSTDWDTDIKEAFRNSPKVNSCAFSFAIDTSPIGLDGGQFPPGIRAVETTANWRTQLFHLPYGDQCLSIPRHVFEYIGGFPDQCLMEDYELIRLLRQRVAQLGERLAILKAPAYCSPRRWQTFGAFYVTWTNSKCVNLYSRGDITPDDLFRLYYGSPNAPARTHPQSPWEVELEKLLKA